MVELAYIGKIPRNRLANIVISCDFVIVIIFVINIAWLSRSIAREQYDVNNKYVQMADFSVRIKHLPPKETYEHLD